MKKHIHIIGGGVIGLTSAWYLMDEGYDVTIIDKLDLSDGTSHGNAGMIVPSHFVPMAAPGVIRQGIKWMFDAQSPFYVKPRMSLDLIQWLWKFYRNCNADHVSRTMPSLYEFNEWSKRLYSNFASDPRFEFCFEEKGLLMLYKSIKQAEEEQELAHKATSLGIEARVLDAQELKALEPDINLDAIGGVYFPSDAHLYPNRFIQQLQKQLQNRGAAFVFDEEIVDFTAQQGMVNDLLTRQGRRISVDEVVLCTGSWTSRLLKKLGVKLMVQDGKGYSFTIKNASMRPAIPTILTESKVAVTPMGDDLRIGGTLELGGLSAKVHAKRIQGIVDSIPRYYPDLHIRSEDLKQIWIGYRPCTPDGLPYIGRLDAAPNITVATGHGMMGMSMGPATGKLVSEIISDQSPSIDLSLYDANR